MLILVCVTSMIKCFIFSLSVCWNQVEDILHLKTRGARAGMTHSTSLQHDTESKPGHFKIHLNKHVYYMISKHICATSQIMYFFSVIYLLFFSVIGREHHTHSDVT